MAEKVRVCCAMCILSPSFTSSLHCYSIPSLFSVPLQQLQTSHYYYYFYFHHFYKNYYYYYYYYCYYYQTLVSIQSNILPMPFVQKNVAPKLPKKISHSHQ